MCFFFTIKDECHFKLNSHPVVAAAAVNFVADTPDILCENILQGCVNLFI
jgi:hypothetical protein